MLTLQYSLLATPSAVTRACTARFRVIRFEEDEGAKSLAPLGEKGRDIRTVA